VKFWNEWVFDGTSDGLGRLVAGVAPTIKTRSDAAYWAYHLFRTSWFMGQGATGLLAGGDVENKHSTGVESPHPSLRFCKSTIIRAMSNLLHRNTPHVCISFHPECESCSDLGRVLVLNDPPTWRPPSSRPANPAPPTPAIPFSATVASKPAPLLVCA